MLGEVLGHHQHDTPADGGRAAGRGQGNSERVSPRIMQGSGQRGGGDQVGHEVGSKVAGGSRAQGWRLHLGGADVFLLAQAQEFGRGTGTGKAGASQEDARILIRR